jgi:hypothetical protein
MGELFNVSQNYRITIFPLPPIRVILVTFNIYWCTNLSPCIHWRYPQKLWAKKTLDVNIVRSRMWFYVLIAHAAWERELRPIARQVARNHCGVPSCGLVLNRLYRVMGA